MLICFVLPLLLIAGTTPLQAQVQPQPAVTLTPEAARSWRLRELRYTPRYFHLVSWKDNRTLFGLAGCNPVGLRVDAPQYLAWNVAACGGAVLAPDGQRVAWGDGKGRIRVGRRGEPQRTVFDPDTRDRGVEGDPTGLMLWSPDGRHLLTSWAVEWDASYTAVDVATRSRTPLRTRLAGYFLTVSWNWLDSTRILFSVQAVRDRAGRSEYSESGGVRTDLALYDLRTDSYAKVTDVADGVFLRPLTRWSERAILVGEAGPGSQWIERYWIYDTNTWSRHSVSLPLQASNVRVADSTSVLIIEQDQTAPRPARTRLILWRRGVARAMAEISTEWTGIEWSPDGRRLAIVVTVQAPVAGMPGSFVTRHVAYVLEPRL